MDVFVVVGVESDAGDFCGVSLAGASARGESVEVDAALSADTESVISA
jgi:hypothetical protein